jgi:membrane associated rhomboid family serine protease
METLRYMLYAPLIVTAYMTGRRIFQWEPKMIGVVSAIVFGLVAIPSLLQIGYPPLYGALASQPLAVNGGHEYWRLLTALTVQNGGLIGTAFNLIALFFVLQIAEPVWGPWRSTLIFLVAGLYLNTLATVIFGVETAGNSGATFALAASLAGNYLFIEKSPKRDWIALICVLIGIILLVLQDVHAYPILGGALLGYLLKWLDSRKPPVTEKKP